MYDSHIHMGQFYEHYYAPEFVAEFLNTENIQKAAISSTTTCSENYKEVINEFYKLLKITDKEIYPILWVTPKMLKTGAIILFLESKIDWKCIKIHGFIHRWFPNGKLFNNVIELAKELNVPILIHTGGAEKCEPLKYIRVIKKNKNQQFILAHGRPIVQTITVMEQCDNAWVDTAFMPLDDVEILIKHNYEDRVLFGTDFPITMHYNIEVDENKEYQNRITELTSIMSESIIYKIFKNNFDVVFKSYSQVITKV